jgi:hypothetical protein
MVSLVGRPDDIARQRLRSSRLFGQAAESTVPQIIDGCVGMLCQAKLTGRKALMSETWIDFQAAQLSQAGGNDTPFKGTVVSKRNPNNAIAVYETSSLRPQERGASRDPYDKSIQCRSKPRISVKDVPQTRGC